MNQAQALYQLQQLDQDISQRKSRLTEIDALLGENTRVQAAEQTLAQAESDLAPWRTLVANLDLEIKSVAAKTESTEQHLYSGAVSNPKEMQDMQEEIASLKRRRAKLEDEMLEAMIEVENGQAAVDESSSNLKAVVAHWNTSQGDLLAEQEKLTRDIAGLREQRATIKLEITPAAMERYKHMYRSKQGQVVAPLKDSNCQVCGVSQTSKTVQEARQARELVYCENCGRILVIL
ncbi:MAG: hypothetical protein JXN59_17785 [Anaerolineae bacterium]|nr:hypothetical protein [Anaerolineae bacterium]